MQNEKLASMIDHTLLKAESTPKEIQDLCSEAREWSFASVCVNGSYVSLAAHELEGSLVKVCTVVGFPLGATSSAVKAFEAKDALENGAQEIDMVINIGRLKAGDDEYVRDDIAAVKAVLKADALLKVILETCLLTDDEKVRGARAAVQAGADFVKTSTGFSSGGATVEDVALIRKVVGGNVGVKASGGIRTREDALRMMEAGASRIGASRSIRICSGESV
ncbi:MAG: deoxyribose-phosphate aldolase [Dethiosulfovibrio peptidovorans]|nr:MAG: deoxyribose-phosphate aldolase [Dethiosulfovibrio peptidovorans]